MEDISEEALDRSLKEREDLEPGFDPLRVLGSFYSDDWDVIEVETTFDPIGREPVTDTHDVLVSGELEESDRKELESAVDDIIPGPKECFYNAYMISEKVDNAYYGEGVGASENFPKPVKHAFNVIDDVIVDVTTDFDCYKCIVFNPEDVQLYMSDFDPERFGGVLYDSDSNYGPKD